MKQDKDYLYIFFQNHQHKKYPQKSFSDHTLKDAKKVKNILKSELEACNHIGFVFYDNKWKLAELDYFRDGRIVRNITESDIKDFQILIQAFMIYSKINCITKIGFILGEGIILQNVLIISRIAIFKEVKNYLNYMIYTLNNGSKLYDLIKYLHEERVQNHDFERQIILERYKNLLENV
jgi:hypothetical protein